MQAEWINVEQVRIIKKNYSKDMKNCPSLNGTIQITDYRYRYVVEPTIPKRNQYIRLQDGIQKSPNHLNTKLFTSQTTWDFSKSEHFQYLSSSCSLIKLREKLYAEHFFCSGFMSAIRLFNPVEKPEMIHESITLHNHELIINLVMRKEFNLDSLAEI